jgi:hypothetical protein
MSTGLAVSTDLAVDELEAVSGVGDLLADSGCQLGKKVAVFEGGGFGVAVQLGDFAGEQRVPLSFKRGDVALGVQDLTRDAEELSGDTFPFDGGADFAMIVKETLQGFAVAAAVGLVGAGHQQRKVSLLGGIAREVGMNAFGNIAKKCLKTRRRIELFRMVDITECGIMGLLRALARLRSPLPGGVGVVEVDFAFGDARLQIIELGIKNANLAEITALEGFELRADLGQLRFMLGQFGANGGKSLALIQQGDIVRTLLKNDLGWHAAFRDWNFQFSRAEFHFSFRK